MQRTSLVVGLLAVAILSVRLDGQSPPDFSGNWTLTSTGTYPPDQRMTITQDNTTLTIDSTGYRIRATSGGQSSSFSETPFPTRVTYVLDGAEHPSAMVAEPPEPPARPAAMIMSTRTAESISKAVWAAANSC